MDHSDHGGYREQIENAVERELVRAASRIRRFRSWLVKVKRYIQGFVARTLFQLHGFVCIWRLTVDTEDRVYWLLAVLLCGTWVETVISYKYHGAGEWKW